MQPCHIVVIHDIVCTCGAHQQPAPLCLKRMMGYERWQIFFHIRPFAKPTPCLGFQPQQLQAQLALNCTDSLVHFGYRDTTQGCAFYHVVLSWKL